MIGADDAASLATTPLTMTPPLNFNGNFTLHVEAVVNDTATLSTGVVTDTRTLTHDIAVVMDAVNDAPEFTGSGEAAFVVGGGAVTVVSGEVAVSDVDSDDYDGGSFTATVTSGGEGDTLSIADNDFISVVPIASGHVVMFDSDGVGGEGAIAIGDLANNSGNVNSVTVSLNDNATDAAVEALARAIQFGNGKSNADAGSRTVTFTLQDGGGTANGVTDLDFFEATVNVASANAAPEVRWRPRQPRAERARRDDPGRTVDQTVQTHQSR